MTTLHANIAKKALYLREQIRDASNSAFCAVASLQHAVAHYRDDVDGQLKLAREAEAACNNARVRELDNLEYTIDGSAVEDYPPKP